MSLGTYVRQRYRQTLYHSGGRKYEKLGGEFSNIVGTRTVREVHSEHAKHALFLGGSGGMPPRKFLKIKCYEIESGGNFSLSQQ